MRWYRAHGRHQLPWRLTRDPYAVLVSEVMLQQTQVERVLPYWRAWMERWPTFEALAAAPVSEVIRAWRGLGYNRRAIGIHRTAIAVISQHGGALPEDPRTVQALPGVGPYTESAIRCFAREEPVSVADTNIARVVARTLCARQHEVPAAELRQALECLLPEDGVRDHNLALMDLGALVCTARNPRCGNCPVAGLCAWRAAGHPLATNPATAAPKFETTARFARGRIVDALREAPATSAEITAMLPVAHRQRVPAYLAALEKDGLVVEVAGAWSLPG